MSRKWLLLLAVLCCAFVAAEEHEDHEPRSGRWPRVRADHLAANPSCICCGRKADRVHHLKPFHLHPELELEDSNLRSMCQDCHFSIGHLWNFKNENPDLDKHAKMLLEAKAKADKARKTTVAL